MHSSLFQRCALAKMIGIVFLLFCITQGAIAACPYMPGSSGFHEQSVKREGNEASHSKRATPPSNSTDPVDIFLDQFTLNDTDSYLTSDVGGPIQDQLSLKAGVRGPTLLEDFMFRQKIQHFDHERVRIRTIRVHLTKRASPLGGANTVTNTCLYVQVPERAVHARGAGMCLCFYGMRAEGFCIPDIYYRSPWRFHKLWRLVQHHGSLVSGF